MQEIEKFYPKTKQQWRKWLEKNHQIKDAVWLIFYNKSSTKQTISWSDAVDEALCFGWIDSVKKSIDQETSIQFFSKRKAKSTWSKINKEKVEKLIQAGLMSNAGLSVIDIAKQDGSWHILDEVENLIIPDDLLNALKARENAEETFNNLSKSAKKLMLTQLVLAKKSETRQNRIAEIVVKIDKKSKLI